MLTCNLTLTSKQSQQTIINIINALDLKWALSQIISISLNSQNIYFCHRKPTNSGLFLLTFAILVC